MNEKILNEQEEKAVNDAIKRQDKKENEMAGDELTTEEFFKRRFPDKDIEFEKKCGYFDEWVKRFGSGEPELWMDSDSLKVWEEMKNA